MDKRTLMLFQIIFVNTVLSHCTATPGKAVQTRNIVEFDEADYFVSSITASWSTAQQSCANIIGTNSSLVSIETLEEWYFLKIMLESYGIGTTYWSSGMYDGGSRVWRWSANNIEVMPWAPWDNGHPPSIPSGIHRILISYTNRTISYWRTVQNSQPNRYICERYREPTEPVDPITCKDDDNDLVIVLDSSASIGSHNYKKAKQFASSLFANVTLHNNSRIALFIYSDTATSIISLNNTLSPEEVTKAILDAPYLRGDTNTHLGIDAALAEFISFPRVVPQNVVVITDGESSNSTLTAAAIERAVDSGVTTVGVGVSPSANQTELLVIASGNSDYVFSSDKCDEMFSLLDPLARKICSLN